MLKENIQVSDKKFTRLLSTMSSPDCNCSIVKHNAFLWYTYRLMHSASELSGFMRTSSLTLWNKWEIYSTTQCHLLQINQSEKSEFIVVYESWVIISNYYWMRLSRIWRILQIYKGITPSEICRILYIQRKPNLIIYYC